jgi:hypothetical protein
MWTRPAAEIQKAIHNTFGVAGLVLDFLKCSEDPAPCVVVRFRSSFPSDRLMIAPLDEVAAAELSPSERNIIKAICADDAGSRGSFSRFSWIDEAMSWMREIVGQGVEFTEEIEQLNAGGTFALLRFATRNGPAYWLKATGAPNRHEFAITTILAATCPECLPPLIGVRHDWNAWVMEEAGDALDQQASVSTLKSAATSMATLQKKTIQHTDKLLAAGATDQRTSVLRGHIAELISYLKEAMEHQTSTKVPPLEVSRLEEIGITLLDAYDAMGQLGIPETLMHNDLNHGNILVHNDACVFTDCCEILVGNPFVTAQRLLMLFSSDGGQPEVNRSIILGTYKQCWLDVLAPWQIEKAVALMPLLTVVSYLYGRGDWLHSDERRQNLMTQSYARSLAQHMDREARNPLLVEALCH